MQNLIAIQFGDIYPMWNTQEYFRCTSIIITIIISIYYSIRSCINAQHHVTVQHEKQKLAE